LDHLPITLLKNCINFQKFDKIKLGYMHIALSDRLLDFMKKSLTEAEAGLKRRSTRGFYKFVVQDRLLQSSAPVRLTETIKRRYAHLQRCKR